MSARDASMRVAHTGDSVEIVARLERRRVEALALELRALARRYGLGAPSVHILPADRAATTRRKDARSDE